MIALNKRLLLIAGLALSSTALSPDAKAATYTLDFNTSSDGGAVAYNTNGTLNTSQWADWGLSNISGFNNRTSDAAKFNTYNTTTNAGRQDGDLRTGDTWGTVQQGNALIIQEENGANRRRFNRTGEWRADDEAAGGYVNFDFAEAVAFNSFSLLDIDDNGGGIMVEGQQADGSLFSIDIDALMSEHRSVNGSNAEAAQGTSVSLSGVTMTQLGNRQGDNSMFRFDIDQVHLDNVRFNYPGSGAIAGLEWVDIDREPQEIPEPAGVAGLVLFGLLAKQLKRKPVGSSVLS